MKKYYLIIAILLLSILTIIIFFPPQKKSSTPFTPALTIQKSTGSYSYENTSNTFQTYFKDSPIKESSVSFKTGDSRISFYTPEQQIFGNLNSSTSVAKNNTITYRHIFTDTDLKYTISPKRLLEEFIVSTQPTALKFTRISQIAQTENIDQYLTNSDGSISFLYQNQVKFILPKPVLYEFNHQENKNYGIEYQITKTLNNSYQIDKVITPDGLAWLANLNRDYPIAIDLVIDNADTASNWVSSDTTSTVVSQETTIKQEGTGSVKVQTIVPYSTTIDLMDYSDDAAAQAAYVTNTMYGTGGTVTDIDGSYSWINGGEFIHPYRYHTFRQSGTLSVTNTGNLEAVVLGGGGGGADPGWYTTGGGGGAGGIAYSSSIGVSSGSYSATVGTSGAGGASATNGGNSTFSSLTGTGGGAGGEQSAGSNGGCGGGAGYYSGGGGTGSQGGNGGAGYQNANQSAGGGGGGMGGNGIDGVSTNGGNGGVGTTAYSAWLQTVGAGESGWANGYSYIAGGGGAGDIGSTGGENPGGRGGGGDNGVKGLPNTGGGGGGGSRAAGGGAAITSNGKRGGSGIVLIRYPLNLWVHSRGGIQGSPDYIAVFAKAPGSLNQSLTRTIASPINLTNHTSINFTLYSWLRTGSNIKIGFHDSGGTTTEITPNITSTGTWQNVSLDLSGVSNANKDAIDKIIITIVNADSDNLYYINDITAYHPGSTDNTITLTKTATDMSTLSRFTFWIRSNLAGQTLRFQFGESNSSEQTYNITIGSTNTWEQKTWDIRNISAAARNAVTKLAFKITDASSAQTFYFDDLQLSNAPPDTPVLDSPWDGQNVSVQPSFTLYTTDGESDYLRYFIKLCTNFAMSIGCSNFDQTSSQVGWSGQDTQSNTAYSSGTTATYTLQYNLADNSNYYWQAKAIDPGGTNTWSSYQTEPNAFSTGTAPIMSGNCLLQKSPQNTSIIIKWLDLTPDENGYAIQKKIDSGLYSNLITNLSAGTTAYTDNSVSSGHTYKYRIAPFYTGPIYADWCETPSLNLQTGSIKYEGILFQ